MKSKIPCMRCVLLGVASSGKARRNGKPDNMLLAIFLVPFLITLKAELQSRIVLLTSLGTSTSLFFLPIKDTFLTYTLTLLNVQLSF